jgi:hypothetical protein
VWEREPAHFCVVHPHKPQSVDKGVGRVAGVPAKNSIDRNKTPYSLGRQRVEGLTERARAPDLMAVRTGGSSCSHQAGVLADLSRLQVGNTSLQSGNNSSSRPPYVAVMQSADLRQFNDRPQLRRLNRSGLGCIFLQRQVSAGPVVVSEIQFERLAQRLLVEYDEVIQALPSNGSVMWRSSRQRSGWNAFAGSNAT